SVSLLTSAVEQRWSRADDLVSGIEDLAVRAAAISAPDTDIEGELFSVSRTVAENPELELALGSRLGDADAKAGLFEKVFGGSTSEATNVIVSSLVRQPRERRIRQLLSGAMRTVSDQRGKTVATVIPATPLSAEQAPRLAAALAPKY